VRFFLAVTDHEWFAHIRRHPELEEVSFRRSEARGPFRAVEPGEPVLFKLQAPFDAVVGGAYFAREFVLSAGFAWRAFGSGNGADSLEALVHGSDRAADAPVRDPWALRLRSLVLTDPFVFDESEWLAPPADFARHVSAGKVYSTRSPAGLALWTGVCARLGDARVRGAGPATEVPLPIDDLRGAPPPAMHRIGPGYFAAAVGEAYDWRCAITDEPALPALRPCHIRPIEAGGQHRTDNGLLLRHDLADLFEAGYITVTPEFQVAVSGQLLAEDASGSAYGLLDGRTLRLPRRPEERPGRAFLTWHGASVSIV
jgi:putative restriction endonuclease